jgi:hypothetical protein
VSYLFSRWFHCGSNSIAIALSSLPPGFAAGPT